MKFYDRYSPPPSPSLKCDDASLTRQEFVKESDLNDIMRRYAAGEPLPSGKRLPMFDDFSNVPDYQTSLQIVLDAQERFSLLPSDLRRRFGDDPSQLLEFLSLPGNFEEAVKLGLISPKTEVKSEVKTETVSPSGKEGGSAAAVSST